MIKLPSLKRFISFIVNISLLLTLLVASKSYAAPTILVFGDSLSAAYQINKTLGWVSLLQAKLKTEHFNYTVVNASVSGETTAGGLSRLQQQLDLHHPSIVILELGANDGLRGLPLTGMQANLSAMIKQSQQAKANVLLLGVKIPPNYGFKYTKQFHQTYLDLADKHNIAIQPFFLERVAGKPNLNLNDGIHPNEQAQIMILDNVWPSLLPLLSQIH